jgi:hypothetical protein
LQRVQPAVCVNGGVIAARKTELHVSSWQCALFWTDSKPSTARLVGWLQVHQDTLKHPNKNMRADTLFQPACDGRSLFALLFSRYLLSRHAAEWFVLLAAESANEHKPTSTKASEERQQDYAKKAVKCPTPLGRFIYLVTNIAAISTNINQTTWVHGSDWKTAFSA